ncbi:MAG: 5'/3'-nucleotidase SurE, partial [Clostridium sp.]|nr:5'/3'-nucleotidase SurE [Clostridium sp.]
MKILITNDDGINARGIIALAKEISKKHEIIVVAPREQKSASSHSISIHNPIKIREEKLDENFKAYSLVGTPADCTQAGLSLLGGDIDIVISGINRGLNCGTDILYSGTVSAAVEGAIYSVPSIAISMDVDWSKEDEDYSKAAKWISKILDVAEKDYLKENVVLNVNVPNINEEDIKGLKVCR